MNHLDRLEILIQMGLDCLLQWSCPCCGVRYLMNDPEHWRLGRLVCWRTWGLYWPWLVPTDSNNPVPLGYKLNRLFDEGAQ